MALTTMQQELWAAEIDEQLTTMTVAGQVCDTSVVPMEGGDKWHIILASDVSTFSVDDSTDITYSDTTDTEATVTKNFDKGFALAIYDTNKMQTRYAFQDIYARNGAYQLASDLDTAVLGDHASWTNFDNGGTDWQFTQTTCANLPAFFAKLKNTMRTAKVDNRGMPYVVGPEGLGEAIETYTGGRATDFGDQVILNGQARAFTYLGFRVFISSNCTTVSTTTHGMAGIMGYGQALGKYVDPKLIEDVGRLEGWDVEFNSTVVATS